MLGYGTGTMAPGLEGIGTLTYIAAHNQVLNISNLQNNWLIKKNPAHKSEAQEIRQKNEQWKI